MNEKWEVRVSELGSVKTTVTEYTPTVVISTGGVILKYILLETRPQSIQSRVVPEAEKVTLEGLPHK